MLKDDTESDWLLTPEQLAEWLILPTATLTQWRSRRVGPRYLRVGRHIRYRASDVERWLQTRECVTELDEPT